MHEYAQKPQPIPSIASSAFPSFGTDFAPNAFIESFNGSVRSECLNENWFLSLADAVEKIEAWRVDYNEQRPVATSKRGSLRKEKRLGRISIQSRFRRRVPFDARINNTRLNHSGLFAGFRVPIVTAATAPTRLPLAIPHHRLGCSRQRLIQSTCEYILANTGVAFDQKIPPLLVFVVIILVVLELK